MSSTKEENVSNSQSLLQNELQSIANQPRAIVLIDNIQVQVVSVEINTAQFGYADTYSVVFPLTNQNKPIDRNYFASNQNVMVKIYVGFPTNINNYTTNDLDLLLTGSADTYHDDLGSNLMTISGRDLTSLFIDSQLSQGFPNQTSSTIVTTLANQQGLTHQVTSTKAIVGSFYYNQQTLISNQSSQWDLIIFLAQLEGFVCFIQGETLIFEPRQTNIDKPYIINYSPVSTNSPFPVGNFDHLELVTNTTIANNVQVTIRVPYDTKTGSAYSTTVKARRKKGNSASVKKYVYRKPGLSPQQATQLANQLLEQHTSQGVGLSVRLPGDNLLKKDSVIKLTGTDTDYDQYYFPDEIHRTISLDHGYEMYCYARNTTQDLEDAI